MPVLRLSELSVFFHVQPFPFLNSLKLQKHEQQVFYERNMQLAAHVNVLVAASCSIKIVLVVKFSFHG
jgi:hypothetical protein